MPAWSATLIIRRWLGSSAAETRSKAINASAANIVVPGLHGSPPAVDSVTRRSLSAKTSAHTGRPRPRCDKTIRTRGMSPFLNGAGRYRGEPCRCGDDYQFFERLIQLFFKGAARI